MEGQALEGGGEDLEVGVQEFEVVGACVDGVFEGRVGREGLHGDCVHVDG